MKKVWFWLAAALTFAVMLVVLELGQNRAWGFLVALLLAVIYVLVSKKLLPPMKWYWRLAVWAAWVGLFVGAVILTRPPVKAVPAAEGGSLKKTDIIAVSDGQLRGVVSEDGAVEVFAGVPYAKPPVNELRWRPPVDPEPWTGVLEAEKFAPMSMQPTNSVYYDSLARIIGYHDYKITLSDNYVPPVSEDSLYLNIWRPAGGGEGLPVLVYIHGGSLQTGQPWYGDYSGDGLAREGVIVVNMGYRLGVFGFLALPELYIEDDANTTGNYGLLDQIKALEWVKENIAAFGGDPDNVTLAGESAGSACVSALCTSPLAKGLFRRAIMESSTVASPEPPHSFRTLADAFESGKELMARYGVSSADELRAIPAKDLVDEAYTQHHMTVDGYALTETPYESYKKGLHNEEAILHGCNSEEAGPFVMFSQANLKNFEGRVRDALPGVADEALALYPVSADEEAKAAWEEIWGALYFEYPHYCLNRLAAENGIPVWQYYFSKDNGRLGAWHSGEEIYFYGNMPGSSRLFTDRDRELAREMTACFVSFIKTGDPNSGAAPEWKQNVSSEDLMGFGETTGMIKERKLALYALLDRMYESQSSSSLSHMAMVPFAR